MPTPAIRPFTHHNRYIDVVSVRFVIGRCGTGKTWYCFSKIVEAMRAEPLGPAIFWILPKQATFQAERELTVNSGLAGFARCRVVSFDQLGRDVLQELSLIHI